MTYGYFHFPKSYRLKADYYKFIAILHNIVLVGFSASIFIQLSFFLLHKGIIIDDSYYFSFPSFQNIVFLFYLSKYVEYFDTFLIYLKGKTPSHLQLYHHSGAAITWHIAISFQLDCFWIPTLLNSFVHTIMYSYYLACLFNIHAIKKYKKYLTVLQISQLVSFFAAFYLYYPKVSPLHWNIMVLCGFANIYQIYLFLDFYYQQYKSLK